MLVKDLFCEKPEVKLHTVICVNENEYYMLGRTTLSTYQFIGLNTHKVFTGTIHSIEGIILVNETELKRILGVFWETAEYIGQLADIDLR